MKKVRISQPSGSGLVNLVCSVINGRRERVATGFLLLMGVLLSGCITVNGADSHRTDSEELFRLATQADKAYVESRWIDAAREYQRLADLVPEDPYAWFRLGNTYAQQGAFNQAISAYQSSIERNPNQPKPWYNLATAHLLNAQNALRKSYAQLRVDDPARSLVDQQLVALESVIYHRMEDIAHPGARSGY